MSSSEWKTKEIGEIGKVVTGKTPSTQKKENFGEKYPFITPRDMTGQKKIYFTERYLSEKGKNSVKNCLLPKNSVCVSCIGSDMGKVVMTTSNSITNQQLNSIICNDSFDPDFVYYSMVNISSAIKNLGKGSTAVPILNKTDFSRIKIATPDISTQKQIANILSSLDEKIELNRQTNVTLEAIAQAIFKEWFIDFNFPGATGEMIESELGLIPKGWRVGKLGEIVELRNERVQASLETKNLPYVPIDLISPKSLSLQNFHNGDQAKTSLIKFYKEDIIFGAMRPYFHKVCIAPFAGTTRTTAFVLYPMNKFDYSFMTLILHDPKTIEYATQNSTGSTIPYAKWNGSMDSMLIIIPPEKIRLNFNEIIKPLLDSIHPKIFEINTLTTIKDSLLPKLMNGEIEINY